jgi:hypothetical protein
VKTKGFVLYEVHICNKTNVAESDTVNGEKYRECINNKFKRKMYNIVKNI